MLLTFFYKDVKIYNNYDEGTRFKHTNTLYLTDYYRRIKKYLILCIIRHIMIMNRKNAAFFIDYYFNVTLIISMWKLETFVSNQFCFIIVEKWKFDSLQFSCNSKISHCSRCARNMKTPKVQEALLILYFF